MPSAGGAEEDDGLVAEGEAGAGFVRGDFEHDAGDFDIALEGGFEGLLDLEGAAVVGFGGFGDGADDHGVAADKEGFEGIFGEVDECKGVVLQGQEGEEDGQGVPHRSSHESGGAATGCRGRATRRWGIVQCAEGAVNDAGGSVEAEGGTLTAFLMFSGWLPGAALTLAPGYDV